MKVCKKCHLEKDFYKCGHPYFYGWCKDCVSLFRKRKNTIPKKKKIVTIRNIFISPDEFSSRKEYIRLYMREYRRK